LGKLVVIGGWKEMEVAGEQQVTLQFTGGTASDPTESSEFRISTLSAALSQVGADGGTGTTNLTAAGRLAIAAILTSKKPAWPR